MKTLRLGGHRPGRRLLVARPAIAAAPGSGGRPWQRPVLPPIFLLLLLGGPLSAAPAPPTWHSSVAAAQEQAAQAKKLLFLELASARVPACARRDQEVYREARLARVLTAFVCVRLDAERDRAAVAQWQPTGFPTLIVLQADGTEIARPLATLAADALAERLEQIRDDERALGELRAKLAATPADVPSRLALCRIYLRRGNAAAARPLIDGLAAADDALVRQALPSLWLGLAMALGRGAPGPKGKEYFERVIREFPESREAEQAYFLLHMVHLMAGDREAAARSLERVVESAHDAYLRERAERALRARGNQ